MLDPTAGRCNSNDDRLSTFRQVDGKHVIYTTPNGMVMCSLDLCEEDPTKIKFLYPAKESSYVFAPHMVLNGKWLEVTADRKYPRPNPLIVVESKYT